MFSLLPFPEKVDKGLLLG